MVLTELSVSEIIVAYLKTRHSDKFRYLKRSMSVPVKKESKKK